MVVSEAREGGREGGSEKSTPAEEVTGEKNNFDFEIIIKQRKVAHSPEGAERDAGE
jgi:hypothetical protein